MSDEIGNIKWSSLRKAIISKIVKYKFTKWFSNFYIRTLGEVKTLVFNGLCVDVLGSVITYVFEWGLCPSSDRWTNDICCCDGEQRRENLSFKGFSIVDRDVSKLTYCHGYIILDIYLKSFSFVFTLEKFCKL